MSGGDGDCSGTSVHGMLTQCNLACTGQASDRTVNECIAEIDCFNNGGYWDGDVCVQGPGICSDSGVECDDDNPCPGDKNIDHCERYADSCHTRELCLSDDPEILCFEPPGPAGSSTDCKLARKNNTYVVPQTP